VAQHCYGAVAITHLCCPCPLPTRNCPVRVPTHTTTVYCLLPTAYWHWRWRWHLPSESLPAHLPSARTLLLSDALPLAPSPRSIPFQNFYCLKPPRPTAPFFLAFIPSHHILIAPLLRVKRSNWYGQPSELSCLDSLIPRVSF